MNNPSFVSSMLPDVRLRFGLWMSVMVAILALASARNATAQGPAYGPPNIAYNGVLLAYYGTLDTIDVYTDGQTVIGISSGLDGAGNAGKVVSGILDGNTSPHDWEATGEWYYSDSHTFVVGTNDLQAVGDDGLTFLGSPDGVTVRASGSWVPGTLHWSNSNPDIDYDHAFINSSGETIFHYPGLADGSFFQIGGSPVYRYPGGLFLLDYAAYSNTSIWTPSNVPFPPLVMYVNGKSYVATSVNIGYDGGQLWDYIYYTNAETWAQTTVQFVSGEGYGSSIYGVSVWGNAPDGRQFLASVDLSWHVSRDGLPPTITVSFAEPAPTVSFGPQTISMDGVGYPFSYYDPSGLNVYTAPASGGRLVMGADGAIQDDSQVYGWYDFATQKITPGASYNILALDHNGDPVDQSDSIVFYHYSPLNWVVVTDASGSGYPVTYTFQRGDGSFGAQIFGVPRGSVFMLDYFKPDGVTRGGSPTAYRYESGVMIVSDASGEWGETKLYPTALYVNGSKFERGPLPYAQDFHESAVSGSVTYTAVNSNDFIGLSWSWSNWWWGQAFGGWSVTASVAAFPNAQPAWDGQQRYFSNVPAGLLITLDPPPSRARYGPPQIDWNGVTLSFDPVASSVSASNPAGNDVYVDHAGLGLKAVIGLGGSVTLRKADGTQIAGGAYDSSKFRFTFGSGANAGSLTAMDGAGRFLESADAGGGNGASQAIAIYGDLDVRGNVFSLGSWTDVNGESLNGFGLSFSNGADQTSLLEFSSTRASVNWIWSHAKTDAGTAQLPSMVLDAGNRLQLEPFFGSKIIAGSAGADASTGVGA